MHSVDHCRYVSFAFNLAGYIFLLISYGSDYWYDDGDKNEGIWNGCENNTCYKIRADDEHRNIKAVQALMTIGLIFTTIALPLFVVWITKSADYIDQNGDPETGIAALGLSVVGGFFIGTGFIAHNVNFNYPAWSGALAIVSSLIIFLNSTISLCVLRPSHCSEETSKRELVHVATIEVEVYEER